jgi:predicted Zn finger-like uncharacterized protein
MKITCPSCSARYSIDDAKVKGKAFKFTCKKCGQTHVYRGTADGSATAVPAGAPAGAAPGGQAPPPASAGGEEEAVWYVAVGEEQQGPYTTQQIREYIQTDQLDPESFMWKEGMEDWLPVQQIAEFSDVYQGGAPAAAPSPSPASAFSGPTADEVTVASPFSPAALPPTDSGDLFAFGGGQAPAPAAKAAAPRAADPSPFGAFGGGGSAAVASRGGADLFGAPAQASPFEAGGEEREEDVMMGAAAAAAPSPRVDARQMIGQRNENSVLFSLSSLQSLGGGKSAAAAGPSSHAAAPVKAGFATGEGSGLIDIKAMAGSISRQEEKHDDMFALGGGAIGAPVAVPILTRPIRHEEESKKPMYILIGVIGAFAVAIVVLLVFLLGKKEETKTPPPTVVAVADAGGGGIGPEEFERLKAEAVAAALAAQDVGSTKPDEDAGASSDAGASGDVGTTDGDPNAKAADGGDGGTAEPEGPRNPGTRRDGGTGRRDEDVGSTANPPPTRDSGTATSRADASRVAGDLTALGIRRDAGTSSTQTTSGLPATPGRDDVRSKFESVRGAVRACTANQAGTASVATTIQGSSGRVTRVNVTGDFTGPAATCINNAIRGLVFPQFSNASLTVNYSYRF